MAISSISALRPSTTQTLAFSGTTATVTNGFGPYTNVVRVSANAGCHFRVVEAAGGSATASDVYLPAGWVDYIVVSPGQKIAAIQAPTNGLVTATAGTLNIVEMT